MKKTVMAVMAVFFLAAVSTSAFASHWGRGPNCAGPQGYGSENFRGMAQLNLTPEQITKLAELRNARTKELMPIQDQLFAKRNVIKALWLEPSPSQEKIVAAQKELGSIRDQMQEKETAYRLESLKVLTPAQQEIIKTLFSSNRPGVPGGRRFSGRDGYGPFSGRGGYGPSARDGFGFGPGCLR